MRRLLGVGLVMVGSVAVVVGADPGWRWASQDPGVPPGYVLIDGAKSPSSVPEWVAWRGGLLVLATSASDPDSVVFHVVGGDEETRKRIATFAAAEDARWSACRDRQLALLERLKDVEPSYAKASLEQEQVKCREALLASKDAFLATLSTARAASLRAFVDRHRNTISSLVPRADLEHFRRPR